MSTRQRVAITAASALALGIATVGNQWSIGDPAADVWGFAVLAVFGLAVVGVFVVNRWWALLPAASTIAISWLGNQVYEPRGHWSTEGLTGLPFPLEFVIMILEAVFLAMLLALGLLARLLWDEARRRRSSSVGTSGSTR